MATVDEEGFTKVESRNEGAQVHSNSRVGHARSSLRTSQVKLTPAKPAGTCTGSNRVGVTSTHGSHSSLLPVKTSWAGICKGNGGAIETNTNNINNQVKYSPPVCLEDGTMGVVASREEVVTNKTKDSKKSPFCYILWERSHSSHFWIVIYRKCSSHPLHIIYIARRKGSI